MQNPIPLLLMWWHLLIAEVRPRLRLGSRWREVLRYAWSVRLFAASVVCQVLDVLLSTAGAFTGNFRWSVALQLAGVAFAAMGLWARLMYQKDLSHG